MIDAQTFVVIEQAMLYHLIEGVCVCKCMLKVLIQNIQKCNMNFQRVRNNS